MFDLLSDKLSGIFSKLKGKGYLSESDVDEAMREVRIALLEADVSLSVAKDFIAKVKAKAIGQEIVKSVSPAQMVIKIVQDNIEEALGGDTSDINLATTPPAVIMMVGLQGSGKTTSSAKLAKYLQDKLNKKVLLASLDIYRPAAQEQLTMLAQQINGHAVEINKAEKPAAITIRALEQAKLEAFDVLILDTAGRLHIDEELMNELVNVKQIAKPIETILVADSLTGQDAVNIADKFNKSVGLTGIILTRIDGDGRGGAALSMKAVTNCPIKFLGSGEKITEFEVFHPKRIASLILDKGDIVSLVEKAAEAVDMDEAKKLERKISKGQFDLNDLASQLKTMRKMGGMSGLMGFIPGMGQLKQKIKDANVDDRKFIRLESIIYSMTKQERKYPKVINGSRKQRIAKGAGVTIQEVNQLLKQFKQMSLVFKKIGKMDKKALMRSGMGNLMPQMQNNMRPK